MRRLRNLLTRAWRRLRNRCQICGDPCAQPTPLDLHSWGGYCRVCNKTLNFARLYGRREP